MKKGYITLITILLCSFAINGEVNISRADKFSSDSLSRLIENYDISPNWINGESNYFYYYVTKGDVKTYYLVNTRNGIKTKIFDTTELIKLLTPYTDEKGLPLKPSGVRVYNMKFDKKNMNCAVFSHNNHNLEYNIKTKRIAEVPVKAEKNKNGNKNFGGGKYWWRSYTADSAYYLYTYDHNLYLYNVAKSDSLQLTTDGVCYYSYATSGNKNDKKEHSSPSGKWVGKSHKYVLLREDKRNVGTMTIVDNLAQPRPKPNTYKFPIPGDTAVVQYSVYEIDADRATIQKLPMDKYPDQKIEVPRFSAFRQVGDYVYMLRKSRAQDMVDLCRINAVDATVTTLISEKCAPHLNEQLFDYHILNNGKEILWWAERNGKGQYLLYDGDGNYKNAVTPDNMVCGAIERIDTIGRNIIFQGFGGEKEINPHYAMYYHVKFSGKDLTLLTPDNGDHSISLSPDGKFVVDHCSRMDMAPEHKVYDMQGKLICALGKANMDKLYAQGWQEPKVIKVLSADSITPLYGIVYLPFDMDKTKKYPIISNVYPGPHTDLVPQNFTLDDNYNQSLAQLGFIVINFSYRGGCPYRGRDYYTYGYGNLRDYALDDDMAVIKQVAKLYNGDLDRVGIYGHSGGGFMSATAILTHPEFYKVAVAASGNYDNNIYTQWWGETFHGVKQVTDSKTGKLKFECKIPTTIELANNLKGKLMLITGDVDNNVHPASTMRLAHALIKANKRFDMFVVPGVDHGLGDKYYINLIRYYFIENLLGEHRKDIDIVKHE